MRTLDELYLYAEEQGIGVDYYLFDRAESLSALLPDGSCVIAVDPTKLRSSLDEKMKIAHEIGHCDTGSFYNRYAALDVRRQHERRADKRAVQLMVTAEDLDAAVAAGHTEIWDLAEFLGLSEYYVRKAFCLYRLGTTDTDAL